MKEIYWITRLDAIQAVSGVAVFILGLASAICFIVWFMDTDDEKQLKDIGFKCLMYLMIPLMLLIFVPSKKDMLMILGIGGAIEFLKQNETAKEIPDKVLNAIDKFLDSEIEDESK